MVIVILPLLAFSYYYCPRLSASASGLWAGSQPVQHWRPVSTFVGASLRPSACNVDTRPPTQFRRKKATRRCAETHESDDPTHESNGPTHEFDCNSTLFN
ncbi:hypothetical protein BS47DRAFT_1394602 [Hydnum rufescens UP504]|uniref:Secreted protein n=1 Tax=Hydnum rufescens UP504 TaxID=1448309 RepID=A0A9P6AUA2_9AGAM|nr:hypothetical protein BS47DRAFT_1394602 [Hydnum rufescens UP504]